MPIIIGNMKSLNKHYDELWFVMRSMDWFYKDKKTGQIIDSNYKLLMQSNVKIVDDLSPSKELFFWYLEEKKKHRWNSEAFLIGYVPKFMRGLVGNPDAKERLNQLWSLDREGKTILIVCSCSEEMLCHRSILAGILHGAGSNVITEYSINNYTRFYNEYRDIETRYKNNETIYA